MTNGNDLAYPEIQTESATGGLTKREYFAAMAMQGLLLTGVYDFPMDKNIVEEAVGFADALIAELNKLEVSK